MKRKSTGKRLRFEVFKRDGFRCLYCGATPNQKVLRVDHVQPVAGGGTDDPSNLVTACFDCNAGKAAVPLDDAKLKVGFIRDEDREHAEQIKEYLALQREIHGAKQEVVDELRVLWEQRLGPISKNMYSRLPGLMADWPNEKLIEAIDITAKRLGGAEDEFDPSRATEQAKYFHGVLRKFREESAKPTPKPAQPSPMSTHARRALEAVGRAVDAIEKDRSLLGADGGYGYVFEQFARAAWGSEDDIAMARGAVEHNRLEVRGVNIEIIKKDDGAWYSVGDVPGFNPHKQAYDELNDIIDGLVWLGPDETSSDEDLQAASKARGEIRAWLAFRLEVDGDPEHQGALESYRAAWAEPREFMKRWGLL